MIEETGEFAPDGIRANNRKVHFSFGWYGCLFIAFLVTVVYGYGIVGGAGGWAGPVIAAVFLAAGLVFFRKSILRVPAVEANEAGVIIRPVLAKGCVFIKWEDIREAVIWYHATGGQKNRMIGIRANEGFTYDNYGVLPRIRPNVGRRRIRGVPRYVGDLVGS